MITVEVKENNIETYPILKIDSKGLIVLFIAKNKGTVLRPAIYRDDAALIGHYSEEWTESLFMLFTSTIQLFNLVQPWQAIP